MLKKTKITKSKPIWNKDLEKQFKEEIKNNSKPSVIKERLKKNIGKTVNVIITSNKLSDETSIEVNMKGKLKTDVMIPNKFYEIESPNLDYITFQLKDIESIGTRDNKTIRIYLK